MQAHADEKVEMGDDAEHVARRERARKHGRRPAHLRCGLLAKPDVGPRMEGQQDDLGVEAPCQLVREGGNSGAQLGGGWPRTNADADAPSLGGRTVPGEDVGGPLSWGRLQEERRVGRYEYVGIIEAAPAQPLGGRVVPHRDGVGAPEAPQRQGDVAAAVQRPDALGKDHRLAPQELCQAQDAEVVQGR